MVQRPIRQATSAIVDSRIMRIGVRLSQDYLDSERARNNHIWEDRRNWFYGFYFGRGDTRLWVPRKGKSRANAEILVVNFSHPKGREAAKVLGLAYLICTTGAVIVSAIALGYRW